jgi:hypothetical protein
MTTYATFDAATSHCLLTMVIGNNGGCEWYGSDGTIGIYGRESLDRITQTWQVESVLLVAVSLLSALYSHIWVLLLRRFGGKLLIIAAVGAIFVLVASAALAFVTGMGLSCYFLPFGVVRINL